MLHWWHLLQDARHLQKQKTLKLMFFWQSKRKKYQTIFILYHAASVSTLQGKKHPSIFSLQQLGKMLKTWNLEGKFQLFMSSLNNGIPVWYGERKRLTTSKFPNQDIHHIHYIKIFGHSTFTLYMFHLDSIYKQYTTCNLLLSI